MKRRFTILAAVLASAATAGLLSAYAGAGAQASPAAAPGTVTVAMHDPGCHWFQAGGKFTKAMSVRGPVGVVNRDIATLKVAGKGRVLRIPVGKRIVLSSGAYRITMLGQAPDDNTLHLTVRNG